MGTRNLTMVISEGKTKVAQYGQWDGYPEGQGKTILTFLQKVDLNKFRERLKSVSFFTKEELEEIEKKDEKNNGKESERLYKEKPWISRDLGGDILNAIMYGKYKGTDDNFEKKNFKVVVDKLIDQTSFAADSLFCEWLWLIDLDKNTFEAYTGFNTSPLEDDARFKHLEKGLKQEKNHSGSKYFPVKHVVTFKLDKLPNETEFLEAFEFLNEEEEDQ
jgi:hypothetical protein